MDWLEITPEIESIEIRRGSATFKKTKKEEICDRCDGDGMAHGSDRPFEYSGPGSFPGPCPKCKGTGKQ